MKGSYVAIQESTVSTIKVVGSRNKIIIVYVIVVLEKSAVVPKSGTTAVFAENHENMIPRL